MEDVKDKKRKQKAEEIVEKLKEQKPANPIKDVIATPAKREIRNTTEKQKVGTVMDQATNYEKGKAALADKKIFEEAHNAANQGFSADVKAKGKDIARYARSLIDSGKDLEAKDILKKAQAALSKGAKKSLSFLGPVGIAASIAQQGDVFAAVPEYLKPSSTNPEKGDEGYDIENPSKEDILKRIVKNKMSRK